MRKKGIEGEVRRRERAERRRDISRDRRKLGRGISPDLLVPLDAYMYEW